MNDLHTDGFLFGFQKELQKRASNGDALVPENPLEAFFAMAPEAGAQVALADPSRLGLGLGAAGGLTGAALGSIPGAVVGAPIGLIKYFGRPSHKRGFRRMVGDVFGGAGKGAVTGMALGGAAGGLGGAYAGRKLPGYAHSVLSKWYGGQQG